MKKIFSDNQIINMTYEWLMLNAILSEKDVGPLAQIKHQRKELSVARDADAVMENLYIFYKEKIQKIHKEINVPFFYEDTLLKDGSLGAGLHFPAYWDNYTPKFLEGINSLGLCERADCDNAVALQELGYVTQESDGRYTGEGLYFKFFSVIDIRIAKGDGTLTRVSEIEKSMPFFERKVELAQNKLSLFREFFAINLVMDDTVVGQDIFKVSGLNGFEQGDAVKLMDNQRNIVYDRKIVKIEEDTVKLDRGLPVELKTSHLARMVKTN